MSFQQVKNIPARLGGSNYVPKMREEINKTGNTFICASERCIVGVSTSIFSSSGLNRPESLPISLNWRTGFISGVYSRKEYSERDVLRTFIRDTPVKVGDRAYFPSVNVPILNNKTDSRNGIRTLEVLEKELERIIKTRGVDLDSILFIHSDPNINFGYVTFTHDTETLFNMPIQKSLEMKFKNNFLKMRVGCRVDSRDIEDIDKYMYTPFYKFETFSVNVCLSYIKLLTYWCLFGIGNLELEKEIDFTSNIHNENDELNRILNIVN